MLTKIKVEKTYWVGMTESQKHALLDFLKNLGSKDAAGDFYSEESQNVVADLRQALLNV